MAKRARPRTVTATVNGKAVRPVRRKTAPARTASIVVRPEALAATPGPAPGAVALFERGMRALQRHRYLEAAEAFRGLAKGFPNERAVLDRSRLYLNLCERELARQPAAPSTVEERLTSATAALNNGDEAGAEHLARSVLGDQPNHDLAWYLLAVIDARRGASDSAVAHLARAIDYSPDVRVQARLDSEFASLRHIDAFRDLVDSPPAGSAGSGNRWARRGRAER
jgi:tetratricopeptide (TPR) repeat protein